MNCIMCNATHTRDRATTCSPECGADLARLRHRNQRWRKLGKPEEPLPVFEPIEVVLMREAGTAIIRADICRRCHEPIRIPVPDNPRICTWCWANSYMRPEDRQRLKETSRW